MIEIRGNGSEQGHKEISLELAKGPHRQGIERNESWSWDAIWNMEPTPEVIERLIEWFSDERK